MRTCEDHRSRGVASHPPSMAPLWPLASGSLICMRNVQSHRATASRLVCLIFTGPPLPAGWPRRTARPLLAWWLTGMAGETDGFPSTDAWHFESTAGHQGVQGCFAGATHASHRHLQSGACGDPPPTPLRKMYMDVPVEPSPPPSWGGRDVNFLPFTRGKYIDVIITAAPGRPRHVEATRTLLDMS